MTSLAPAASEELQTGCVGSPTAGESVARETCGRPGHFLRPAWRGRGNFPAAGHDLQRAIGSRSSDHGYTMEPRFNRGPRPWLRDRVKLSSRLDPVPELAEQGNVLCDPPSTTCPIAEGGGIPVDANVLDMFEHRDAGCTSGALWTVEM